MYLKTKTMSEIRILKLKPRLKCILKLRRQQFISN